MILHVLAPGPVGGLESVVRLLSGAQAARGRRVGAVLVLDPGAEEHPLAGALRDAGVAVWPLVVPPRAYAQERRDLRALFVREAPQVVHLHGYRPDVLAGGVARGLGIPTATTVHGFTGGGWKNRLYEWLQVRAFRRTEAVIAVSRPLVERLASLGVPRGHIHFIRNAFAPRPDVLERAEARAALGLEADAFVLGWVGRLSREKGADVFVRALARLRDTPVTGSIIGNGRERAELERLALELGVADRLRWHGQVPEAGRYAAAFDGFVLSSRTEGTPIALLEAIAAGTPVVATAVGGVPDVVGEDGGLLVPAEAPDPLATALRRLYEDPASAGVRAAAARARIGKEFAIAPWLDRHDALYAALAAERRASPHIGSSSRRTRA